MADKVCERCGALYSSMKSTTCPECFAKLLAIDHETYSELLSARQEIQNTEQFRAAKTDDDEVFRHQSFKACMVTVAIIALTVLFCGVMLVRLLREHQNRSHSSGVTTVYEGHYSGVRLPGIDGPPPGSDIESVLPSKLGNITRTEVDRDSSLPGTLIQVFHAVYSVPPDHKDVAVSAIPETCPPRQLAEFADAFALTSNLGVSKQSFLVVDTTHWRYALVGGQGDAAFGPAGKVKLALQSALH